MKDYSKIVCVCDMIFPKEQFLDHIANDHKEPAILGYASALEDLKQEVIAIQKRNSTAEIVTFGYVKINGEIMPMGDITLEQAERLRTIRNGLQIIQDDYVKEYRK